MFKKTFAWVMLAFFTLFLLLSISANTAAADYPTPSYGAQPVQYKLENRIPITIAHKADWRNFPEISLLAINSSINMGVDMVELDVNVTADGVVVLLHDENIRRVTDADTAIAVSSLTWAQLKGYALEPGMGNKGYTYTLTAEDAAVLNALKSYKSTVGTAVKGGTMPVARFDTALELINKRCLLVLDKCNTAERFAACYEPAREADMLDYVLFKNSLDCEAMKSWYEAAAAHWNKNHPAVQISAEDVKTSIRYECCTTNRKTLQAHLDDGVNLTSVSVGVTDSNRESIRSTFIPWCEAQNIAVRANTGEGLGTTAGIDSQMGWSELLELGVTEIMTDHPGELISYLQTVRSIRTATQKTEAEHFNAFNYRTAAFSLPLDYDSSFNKRVEGLKPGDHLAYGDILFEGSESMLSVFARGTNSTLYFYLDGMEEQNRIASFAVNTGSYQSFLAEVKLPAKGMHTIFVTAEGSIDLDYFRFSNSLFFGFDNSQEAKVRYNDPVYGGINFDSGSWLARSATMSAATYDKEAGSISASLTTGGNHYIQTGSSVTQRPLSYCPKAGDHFQLRLRIDNAAAYQEGTALTVGLVFSGTGCGDFDYNERNVVKIAPEQLDAGYFTVTIPLRSAFTQAEQIHALRLYFTNLTSAPGMTATITVDHVYIGPKEGLPEQGHLLFDYTNKPTDQIRYTTEKYGRTNFDNGNWLARSATMDGLWINRDAGWLHASITEGGNHYIQTGKTVSAHPLRYTPQAGDHFQMRVQIRNASPHNTQSPITAGLVFSGVGCGEFNYDERVVTQIAPDAIGQGFFTVTLPLNDAFTGATQIQALRLYFTNLAPNAGGNGEIIVDYVYIGPESAMPTQHNYKAVVTAPTCTEKGFTTHACTNCGNSYVDSYVDAHGHQYESRIQGDRKIFTCIYCGHSYVLEIPTEPTEPEPTEPGKTGILCEDGKYFYYVNGEIQYAAGLVCVDGAYYYIRSGGYAAIGSYWCTNTNGITQEGFYIFAEDGKMILTDESKTGIYLEDGKYYYYIDGEIQFGAGLVFIDGSYYYIRSNGYAAIGSYWCTNTNGITQEGFYIFAEDGKMILTDKSKTGIYCEDGLYYYYVKGEIQFGAGLVLLDGAYYYIRSGGYAAIGEYYVAITNGLLPEGTYTFGNDGKMLL